MMGKQRIGSKAGGALAAAFGGALFLVSVPALAHGAQPTSALMAPDDGGIVTVNGVNFEDAPRAEQEVACGASFLVQFYNFGVNQGPATVTFTAIDPTAAATLTVTGGDPIVATNEDDATGPDDLDAEETYTVTFAGEPDADGFFHFRLRIFAPGAVDSNGENRTYRMACEQPTTPPTTTTTTPPTTAPTTSTTTTPPTSTAPTTSSTTSTPPPSTTPPTTPPTTALPSTSVSTPPPPPTNIDSGYGNPPAGGNGPTDYSPNYVALLGLLGGLGLSTGGVAMILRARRTPQ